MSNTHGGEIALLDWTAEAAADLSNSQFLAVELGTNGLANCTVSTMAIGIAQDGGITGAAIPVRSKGVSFATIGANVARGAELQVGASGKLITKVGTGAVVGRALRAGSTNETVPVILY